MNDLGRLGRHPEPNDTSAHAERLLIELYRKMPGWQKLQQVWDLTRNANELALADISRRFPDASERELTLRLASRRLSAEVMRRVFGWDPEDMGY